MSCVAKHTLKDKMQGGNEISGYGLNRSKGHGIATDFKFYEGQPDDHQCEGKLVEKFQGGDIFHFSL